MMKAMVTGATSGIGAATVRALTAERFEVLAVARRGDRLADLQGETGAQILVGDVRDIAALTPGIERFAPDILVNNAGVGHGIDGLAGIGPEVLQEAIDINVTSLAQLTAAALPGMIESGGGHIVNIGSIAGLLTLFSALYGATKAAVHMFSQNLRFELIGTGVRVTEICPGRVASEFVRPRKVTVSGWTGSALPGSEPLTWRMSRTRCSTRSAPRHLSMSRHLKSCRRIRPPAACGWPTEMDRLTGMIALVTGARNGIGKATALALAREGAGLILADCQLGHEFWRTIRVDLFGTLLTCRRVIPEMVTSGGGSIINISSLRAIIGTHGADAYTASKGGVPTMSRAMAVQRAKHSVRVNVLAPGVVLTERVAAFVRPDNPIYQKSLLGPSEPEDVAFLAQFLASDEARKITGTVMCVDGGASIY